MNRFSLDIETVSTVADPEFDTPSHWSPFAVAVGHQTPLMEEPEVHVTFRSDPSLAAERRMMSDMLDWFSGRIDRDVDNVLVTYNGTSYDIPILSHRVRRLDAETESHLTDRLNLFLGVVEHVDLILEMKDREGYWVSLDDALKNHGIRYDAVKWLGKEVTGKDMLSFGLELMTDRPNDDLRAVTERYAASDVRPLFELHDSLRDTVETP